MRIRYRSGAQAVAALLALALLAAGCGASSSPSPSGKSDKLRVGVVGIDFSNIDPGKGFTRQIDSFVLETLMKLSPKGEVLPNLAKSVKQTDDVTYTYHLRDDVKFSSGRLMTADDVVASLNYERNPKFSESFRYAAIKDVIAKDAHTVVVTLKAPTASFQYTLALNGFIFDAQHRAQHKADFGKPGVGVIGTGPYVIDQLDATNGTVKLTANAHYWGGKPKIASASIQSFADENGEAIAFRTGELNLAFPADVRSFSATAGAKATSVPGTRQGMFVMNVKVDPWDDVHVRRAVAYALNKPEIVNVSGGNATPDSTIIPPAQLQAIASKDQVDALIASLPSYGFDLDKARDEMRQSSHPNGFSAVLQAPSSGGYVETAQAIAGQLKQIGIDLKVKALSEAEYTKTFSEPHTKMPIQYTFFSNRTPDPGGMPTLALSSSAAAVGQNNFADYVNPQVDALIAKANATTDPAEQFKEYSRLLKIVGEDMPYVPLYAGNTSMVLSDKFTWPTFNAFSNDSSPYVLEILPK